MRGMAISGRDKCLSVLFPDSMLPYLQCVDLERPAESRGGCKLKAVLCGCSLFIWSDSDMGVRKDRERERRK